MKVVINRRYGGFGLSHEAALRYFEIKGINKAHSEQTVYLREIARHDPALVQVVEEMGGKADGNHAKLKVVEIPDDVEYIIEEYDGLEHIAEVHRTWD